MKFPKSETFMTEWFGLRPLPPVALAALALGELRRVPHQQGCVCVNSLRSR